MIDTHTHFDEAVFDLDRADLALSAWQNGLRHLVLIGYLAQYFPRLVATQQQLNQWYIQKASPMAHVAFGLHPFYIQQHQPQHLDQLEQFLKQAVAQKTCIAVGEIGLDTFSAEMKIPLWYTAQKTLFSSQLELAKQFNLPVLLHIRRAHADTLAILKQHRFAQGGIAHAFSGGVEEAKALIKMGFKLGITGQITNPNAKKLRTVVQHVGSAHLVLETDCPDMAPLCCQVSTPSGRAHTRNTPANLPHVLDGLAQVLGMEKSVLAAQLWHNSVQSLSLSGVQHVY